MTFPDIIFKNSFHLLIKHHHLKSAAFLLYDEDYDVWLANPRGSKLSRGHEEYDAEEDLEYWDFR